MRRNDVYVQHNRVELRMPRGEQIWRERYKKGETIRALMKEVRGEDGTASQPEIIISRSDPMFLHKLMEIEIPEIYDGIIEIKSIAREPGERAKVAVASNDERVDPVGACVGMKGVRIHSIVRELSNESIDVIPFDPDPKLFITRALSPAKIKEIAVDEETRTATVLVADDQVSLAIGRGGQNVRLAMKLTGYTIDLVKEGGEDIELIEFKDELGEELYEQLIMLDIETAKEFLRADEKILLGVKDMTPEKLREIRGLMIVEFDEDELRDILPNLRLDAIIPSKEGKEAAETQEPAAATGAEQAEGAVESTPETPATEAEQEVEPTAAEPETETQAEPANDGAAADGVPAAEPAENPTEAQPPAETSAVNDGAEQEATSETASNNSNDNITDENPSA